MPKDQAENLIEKARRLYTEDIQKHCSYHLPKGIKLIDFIIEENEESQKFCVIGVGGGGIDIVKSIIAYSNAYKPLMAHIDHAKLYALEAAHKLFLMCDLEDKELMSVENHRALSKFVAAHQRVYVVTTFGKEIHRSCTIEKTVRHLRSIGREVILIVVKPFLFELTPERIEAINKSLKKLETDVSKMLLLHNQDILDFNEIGRLPMKKCFKIFERMIALMIEEGYACEDANVCKVGFERLLNEQQ